MNHLTNVGNSDRVFRSEDTESTSRLGQVMDSMRRFATASEVLRVLGAVIMIGSMSLFLRQGWHDGNDLERYFMLLAQTLLLTAGGFGLSFFLKENKGARLFFGLSLISVTANFTILGALIYSVVQLDGLLGQYPAFASWVVNDPRNVTLTIAGAVAILAPVTLLAYSIMARRSARWLTMTYLIANACLLIPVRTSGWVGLLAALSVGLALLVIGKHGPKDDTLSSFEGRFSKFTLLIPPGVLFGRSWYLYDMDAMAIATLSIAIYLVVRHLALKLDMASKLRGLLDVASLPLVVTTAFSVAEGLDHIVPGELILPLFAFACVPMIMDLVNRSRDCGRSQVFGLLGTLLVCGSLALNEVFTYGFVPSSIGIAGCAATMLYGYWIKQRWVLYLGGFATACLVLGNMAELIYWFNFNDWITLSILGTGAIVLASVLDRHGASIKYRLESLRRRHNM